MTRAQLRSFLWGAGIAFAIVVTLIRWHEHSSAKGRARRRLSAMIRAEQDR